MGKQLVKTKYSGAQTRHLTRREIPKGVFVQYSSGFQINNLKLVNLNLCNITVETRDIFLSLAKQRRSCSSGKEAVARHAVPDIFRAASIYKRGSGSPSVTLNILGHFPAEHNAAVWVVTFLCTGWGYTLLAASLVMPVVSEALRSPFTSF